MRLVTRSDFDGLACAVLLKAAGLVTEYKFAHPKDIQDGIIEVTNNDILANVPFVAGCGMWFDHHSSEEERLGHVEFKGASKPSPSCARVIWEYFGGHAKFSTFLDSMMEAVDRTDSGMLTQEQVINPKGWYLLSFVMDPRTGLGRYRDYRISNYQLMLDMIEYCSRLTAEEILEEPDVMERTSRYFAQQKEYEEMILRCAVMDGNVLCVDLRNEEEIFSGNRFTMYGMYPACNISVVVLWGLKKQNVVITVGHSILNRTSSVDVGKLMLSYGGGGHKKVGTCQVPVETAERSIREIVNAVKA